MVFVTSLMACACVGFGPAVNSLLPYLFVSFVTGGWFLNPRGFFGASVLVGTLFVHMCVYDGIWVCACMGLREGGEGGGDGAGASQFWGIGGRGGRGLRQNKWCFSLAISCQFHCYQTMSSAIKCQSVTQS